MRHKGKVTTWKDDQGFGFVTPSLGGAQVFLHISAFSRRRRRPAPNDLITYELTFDEKKRPRASNVQFSNAPVAQGRSATPNLALVAAAFLFLASVAAAVIVGRLPAWTLCVYLLASVVTFIVYAQDKSAALDREWRTEEATLHLMALIGGWPGALIAQEMFRHKSTKAKFRSTYWATVVLNCAALAWLVTHRDFLNRFY